MKNLPFAKSDNISYFKPICDYCQCIKMRMVRINVWWDNDKFAADNASLTTFAKKSHIFLKLMLHWLKGFCYKKLTLRVACKPESLWALRIPPLLTQGLFLSFFHNYR
ncbi:MAG: hypothetical protein C0614_07195 [Desulfuromonas sp.]|nr:MAG: hypothetical protein C0614_07195 [Desulfuromonas sp.]